MRSTLISAQRLDRVSHKEKRVIARIRVPSSLANSWFLAGRTRANGKDERENTMILFPLRNIRAKLIMRE